MTAGIATWVLLPWLHSTPSAASAQRPLARRPTVPSCCARTGRDEDAPLEVVVDASVGIKLFLVEPLSDEAHALFARLGAPLVTADQPLARALAAAPFDVRWLGA